MRDRLHFGGGEAEVLRAITEASNQRYVPRIWDRDATLWKNEPEQVEIIQNSLGWLDIAGVLEGHAADLQAFADSVQKDGFLHVCLLGMGGSSLCAEVCAEILGQRAGFPTLKVLDTTDPTAILGAQAALDMSRTLFLVSSKSGSTIESACLHKHFFEKVSATAGRHAGAHFVAITDPGTPLESIAREQGFRRVFLNPPDIGGRYSALSFFGLVPLALLGFDVLDFLRRALVMVQRCRTTNPVGDNPGIVLGTAMGSLARRGRDKLTFAITPALAPLGSWLEQLIAESTGKEGVGILPVDGEPIGPPETYGSDRVFVRLTLEGDGSDTVDPSLQALKGAGHPVLEWAIQDRMDLGAEFFRWEFATAVAGAVLGINPFDQPNVKESKDNTSRLMAAFRAEGRLEEGEPAVAHGDVALYGGDSALPQIGDLSIGDALEAFLASAVPEDYIAIQGYLDRSPEHRQRLEELRALIRDKYRKATTIGFGPRFLHSTGQLHKGGKNNGLFLQITHTDTQDLPVPGEGFTFGTLKRAQALGDLAALQEHGRRVLRIHLAGAPERTLPHLCELVSRAPR